MMVSLCIVAFNSLADGFRVNATRLVYNGEQKNISVNLENTHKSGNFLVKTSVSKDNVRYVPASFIVTPNVFRLDSGNIQRALISYKGENLPKDRESVFYFKATAIPANSFFGEELDASMLKFAFSHTIKIFYRPKELGEKQDFDKKITFSNVSGGVMVLNTSPFYVSLAELKIDGKKIFLDSNNAGMLEPFENKIYASLKVSENASWGEINDYGGVDFFEVKIN